MRMDRVLCGLAAICAAGCKPATTRVVLELRAEDNEARPDRAVLSWFGPEAIAEEALVPADGLFPRTGALGSVTVDLQNRPGDRKVRLVGLKNVGPASVAVARITWRPDTEQRVTVTFVRDLPDSDGDGLPDAIDDDCPGPGAPGCHAAPVDADGGAIAHDDGLRMTAPESSARDSGTAAAPDARSPDAPTVTPVDAREAVDAVDAREDRVEPPPPQGLQAWYRFEDDPNDGVADSSGRGFNGTCQAGRSCPRLVPGRIGSGYEFDGVSQHVRVADDGTFSRVTAFTIACWARVQAAQDAALLSKPFGTGNDNSWQFEINPMGRLSFGGPSNDFVTGVSVTYGPWIHLAGTWDGRSKRFYVDGRLVGTRAQSLTFDRSEIIIGADLGVAPTRNLVIPFRGIIDEVRIYDRALDAAEVAALATP